MAYNFFIAKLVETITGVTDFEFNNKNELTISPNPARSGVDLKSNQQIWEIEVIDVFGKTIIHIPKLRATTGEVMIDISNLSKGFILLRQFQIKVNNNQEANQRIIKLFRLSLAILFTYSRFLFNVIHPRFFFKNIFAIIMCNVIQQFRMEVGGNNI